MLTHVSKFLTGKISVIPERLLVLCVEGKRKNILCEPTENTASVTVSLVTGFLVEFNAQEILQIKTVGTATPAVKACWQGLNTRTKSNPGLWELGQQVNTEAFNDVTLIIKFTRRVEGK